MSMFNLRAPAEHTAAQIPDIKQLAVQTAFHVLHGANARRKAGSGEAFWQFREYEPGDLPRSIDWRQSAKTDRVYIRQHEQHSAQTCVFWCKQHADMSFQSENAPYSKHISGGILALTLALLRSHEGEMVAYSDAQRPGHSEKILDEFEQLLLNGPASILPRTLKIPRHSHFYALSDFLEPIADIRAAFEPLVGRTQNGCLIQVLDPAEIALPYSGRVLFEDMQAEHKTLINNAVDIRSAYDARIQEHVQSVEEMCAQWGWRYALHVTSADFVDSALKIWLEGGD